MPLEVPLDVFEGTRVVDVDLGGVFCVICGPRFGTTERVVARVVIVDLDSTAKKICGVCDTLFRLENKRFWKSNSSEECLAIKLFRDWQEEYRNLVTLVLSRHDIQSTSV